MANPQANIADLPVVRSRKLNELLVSSSAFLLAGASDETIETLAGKLATVLRSRNSGFYRAISGNLAQVLDLHPESPTIAALFRQQLTTVLLNTRDLLSIHRKPEQWLAQHLKVDDASQQRVDELIAAKRGAVLFSAHFGAIDLLAICLNRLGLPLIALTAPTTNESLFRYITRLRSGGVVPMLEPTAVNLRKMVRALQAGICVGITADRDVDGGGDQIEFFGEQTRLPTGSIWLAQSANVPLMGVFARRAGSEIHVTVESPLQAVSQQAEEQREADLFQQICTTLERVIGESPGEWVMFQQMWPLEST